MWSLKLKALQQCKTIQNKVDLPTINNFMIVTLPLLLVLLWYPKISAVQHTKNSLQKHLKQTQDKQRTLQNSEFDAQKLTWLNEYSWLAWQLEKAPQSKRIEQQEKTKARTTILSLRGVGSDIQWHHVINRLVDLGHFEPISSTIKWQLDGQLNVALTLQQVSTVFEAPLLVLPKRFYTPWPKAMRVSTALYWNDAWRANLHFNGDIVYLRKGVWIPELAATLTNMDVKSATFRQQFTVSSEANLSLQKTSDKPIEKKLYYAFAREDNSFSDISSRLSTSRLEAEQKESQNIREGAKL